MSKLESNGKKRTRIIIIGSIFMIIGITILTYSYVKEKKIIAFEYMNLELLKAKEKKDKNNTLSDEKLDIEQVPSNEEDIQPETPSTPPIQIPYIGTLEIPKINLKRGFVSKDSTYNNINYAITILPSASYPDVDKGNFILVAHSGTAAISFFRNLYKLEVGDIAYVNYNNIKYQYRITNIYYEEKTGTITIRRNYDKTTMTLITCTYQDDTKQTVYILELESTQPLS